MKRAMVFTFDIFMAVLLLMLFSFMVFRISAPDSTHISAASLSRKANDFLVVADKAGVLGTMDNETIQLFMNTTLDQKVHARLESLVYNRSLALNRTMNVSRLDEPLSDDFVVARRVVNFFNSSGNLSEIGLFRLYLWWGEEIV